MRADPMQDTDEITAMTNRPVLFMVSKG
jgi:hypothetical protein